MFLGNKYVKEINNTNKLGYYGELAKEFAILTGNMWSGELSVYSPNKIKVRLYMGKNLKLKDFFSVCFRKEIFPIQRP